MNFKKYVEASDTWVDSHYIRGTSTDTLTLPAVIYGDGTAATVTLKGNTVQNGTPTPQNPVDVNGVGELETIGEHAGQYKIPISSANTTTPVYLGEVQTTRKIRKIVFVGSEDENWSGQAAGGGATRFRYALANSVQADTAHLTSICTHLPLGVEGGTWNTDDIYTISNNYLWLRLDSSFTTVSGLKSYLQQQYANGTPVTVWYVLETPTTGIVNEPLMKIGDYSDSLTTSIPTTDGANTLSIGTALQPSEVTANFHGWHPVSNVHEAESGQWD